MRVVGATGVIASSIWLFSLGCAPKPRDVPCTNDGECQAHGEALRYCFMSRCVECVGNSICGERGTCVDGKCSIRCTDARDCREGERCEDGTCARG